MIIIFLVSMILETPYGAKINNFLRTLQLFRTSSDIFIIFFKSSPKIPGSLRIKILCLQLHCYIVTTNKKFVSPS